MYQFTEMFKEFDTEERKTTYRWRGLALGLLLGGLPGWALAHWAGGGAWAVVGVWLLSPVLGYFIGNQIRK